MTSKAAPIDQGQSVPELLSVNLVASSPREVFEAPHNQKTFYGTLYGGQILGQALAAAAATVPGRPANSLHAYFLRGGQPDKPVRYHVEHIRDGRAFANRRVEAVQDGRAIFTMDCAFRVPEPGWEHQTPMPDVPPPEQLEDIRTFSRAIDPELPERITGHFAGANPIELRPVSGAAALARQTGTRRQAWLRVPSLAGQEDPILHQVVLAWMSDFWISGAALVPHRHPLPGGELLLASIDHAIWFHRPARADDWLLYDTDSPSAFAGTGLTRGSIYDKSGRLVATVMQEILQRDRSE